MNFSSVNLGSCWKLCGSCPDNEVIYNEDALLMIYWTVLYWDILCRTENFENSKKFVKI